METVSPKERSDLFVLARSTPDARGWQAWWGWLGNPEGNEGSPEGVALAQTSSGQKENEFMRQGLRRDSFQDWTKEGLLIYIMYKQLSVFFLLKLIKHKKRRGSDLWAEEGG